MIKEEDVIKKIADKAKEFLDADFKKRMELNMFLKKK